VISRQTGSGARESSVPDTFFRDVRDSSARPAGCAALTREFRRRKRTRAFLHLRAHTENLHWYTCARVSPCPEEVIRSKPFRRGQRSRQGIGLADLCSRPAMTPVQVTLLPIAPNPSRSWLDAGMGSRMRVRAAVSSARTFTGSRCSPCACTVRVSPGRRSIKLSSHLTGVPASSHTPLVGRCALRSITPHAEYSACNSGLGRS